MRNRDEDKTSFPWQATISQAPAIVLAVIYSFGFLALNAHLGKYGVYEFSLASPRYLIVGFIFAAFLLVWYLLPGRAIISALKSFDKSTAKVVQLGLRPIWVVVILFNELFRLVFYLCLASKIFSTTFGKIDIQFFLVLSITFFISYSWDYKNRENKFPRLDIIINLIVNISIFITFIKTTEWFSPTFFVFSHMILLSLFANLVSESYEKYGTTMQKSTYDVLFSFIISLIFSASFGYFYYGHVTHAWGGGQLRAVEINVDEKLRKALMDMEFKVESYLKAHLLHENTQEFIVILEGKTIRLPRTQVIMMRMPAE